MVANGLTSGEDGVTRCAWGSADPDYRAYHDTEWGFPVSDDVRLFEKLSLEGFQAGLSWLTILRKLARSLLVALAVSLTSATPALATIRPSDAAATRAYLKARIVVQHAVTTTEPAAIAALAQLEGQVKAGCPVSSPAHRRT